MSNLKYVVLNEHTFGVSYTNLYGMKEVLPLAVSILRGAVNDGTHGSICINFNDTVRDATLEDFDLFRCSVPPSYPKISIFGLE